MAESATKSFESLKSARDVVSRTGHSVALGSLHRYVGGMGSTQHLQTSVSILMALAQDTASPQVQIWALHALTTIAESGGPMFRGFVEPTLNMVLKSLLCMSSTTLEVHVCLGKLLSALITAVGPELQDEAAFESKFALFAQFSIFHSLNCCSEPLLHKLVCSVVAARQSFSTKSRGHRRTSAVAHVCSQCCSACAFCAHIVPKLAESALGFAKGLCLVPAPICTKGG